MNPWDEHIEKDGRKISKVHVMYIDGDSKLCDGCDEEKERIASIRFIGNVWCICESCILDISRVWDMPRKVLLEKINYER